MPDVRTALENFGRTTGEYWSKDNAAFESTKPGFGDRSLRAVNPMSGLGSALGAMHDAAGKGFSPEDTAAAILQSLPTFGLTRLATTAGGGVIKAGHTLTPDLLKTLMNIVGGTGISVAVDTAQAAPSNSNIPNNGKL